MVLEPFDTVATTEFQVTDADCFEENCEGTFLHNGSAMVCNTCSVMIDLDADSRGTRISVSQRWEQFHSNRPRHYHSDEPRMVGGFLEPYEWVSSDDTDGSVSEVSAEEFYR